MKPNSVSINLQRYPLSEIITIELYLFFISI